MPADNANISISVVTEAPKPANALSLNSESTNRVFDSLTKLGIKKSEIQTQGLRLTPQYFYPDNQKPRLTGYQVTHTLNITVCNIADTGKVLDTLVKDGANRINRVSFGLSEDKKQDARNIARKQAALNAVEKVDLYRNVLGLKSKELKSLSESVNYREFSAAYDTSRKLGVGSAPTNVEGGNVDVRVTISTVWEVK